MVAPLLTPKQKKILEFIESFSSAHGYAPSQHEIAKHFGFSSLGTVQNYLVRLERQGALHKKWNARRSTQVINPQPHESESVPLPLVGRVAAGFPIEAITMNESIDVPKSMVKQRGEHFVLKIKGDSMIEDGILEGDYVVIQKQETAHNGQTVVALIDNEATIKRYYSRKGHVELHPANPAYKPLIVDQASQFKIEGVLCGVVRIYP